jgi:excisionase family DNA binding protein
MGRIHVNDVYMSYEDAAEKLDVTVRWICRLVKDGVLRASRFPGSHKKFIPAQDIDSYKRFKENPCSFMEIERRIAHLERQVVFLAQRIDASPAQIRKLLSKNHSGLD